MIVAATAVPWDRGLVYGDGLFETIAVFAGRMPLWPQHRARLQAGLQRLAITADLDALERDCLGLASQQGNAVLRLVVARATSGRGYDPRQSSSAVHQLQAFPAPRYPQHYRQEGVALHLCRYRLPHNSRLAGLKHLNRLDQVLAAAEWNRAQAQEGLLLDESGAVVEGTVSNVFLLRADRLLTPSLGHCGVAGVMRARILAELAPQWGLVVSEQRLLLSDLLSADAVFLCNSVFGIWPVRAVGVSQLRMAAALMQQWQASLDPFGYGTLYG